MAAILDDPDIRERYLGCLRVGMPRHLAAKSLGLSNHQIQSYIAKNSDFAKEVLDARGEGIDPLYEKAYVLALGQECTCGGGVPEHNVGKLGNRGPVVLLHDPGCRFMAPDPDMLKFMLKALDPEQFGSKVTVEHEHRHLLEGAEAFLELEERLRRRQAELQGGQVLELPESAVTPMHQDQSKHGKNVDQDSK